MLKSFDPAYWNANTFLPRLLVLKERPVLPNPTVPNVIVPVFGNRDEEPKFEPRILTTVPFTRPPLPAVQYSPWLGFVFEFPLALEEIPALKSLMVNFITVPGARSTYVINAKPAVPEFTLPSMPTIETSPWLSVVWALTSENTDVNCIIIRANKTLLIKFVIKSVNECLKKIEKMRNIETRLDGKIIVKIPLNN